jgi:hypothetical protein
MPSPLSRRLISLLLLGLFALPGAAVSMTALDEREMSGVTGEGMAFAWTDFRMMLSPDSYIEQVGSAESNTCTGTGTSTGNRNCWRRGDLRWYGASVSGANGNAATNRTDYVPTYGYPVGTAMGNALTWGTGQCANSGIAGLGCPMGAGIANFAAFDNPYVLRVDEYDGVTYEGNASTGAVWNAQTNSGSKQTVLEWVAPTKQDDYRLAFWGEVEVGREGVGGGLLKSQSIIQGSAAKSVLRFFKFTQANISPGFVDFDSSKGCGNADCSGFPAKSFVNKSLGIQYDSYLRGSFRFSVAQLAGNDAVGEIVDFNATEGLYFRGADVHISLGQLFYQALVIDVPRNSSTNAPITDGNITIEIPVLPNRSAVYDAFYDLTNYSGAVALKSDDDGYATARAAYLSTLPVRGGATPNYMPARVDNTALATAGYNLVASTANYYKTHGYAYWGDWSVCHGAGCSAPTLANSAQNATDGVGRNAWNSSGDGVFFIGTTAYNAYAYSSNTVDLRTGGNAPTIISGTQAAPANCANGDYTDPARCFAVNYYSNFAACTSNCGDSGPYNAGSGVVVGSSTTTIGNKTPAESVWLIKGTSAGAAANRSVIPVAAGAALNLGDARVQGLQLNYFRFTSYGAGN